MVVLRGSGANAGAGAEMNGDGMHAICLWKWRKGVFGGGGYVPVPVSALEGLDGIRVKSVAIIEDSDSGFMSFPSNCRHHHFLFFNLN